MKKRNHLKYLKNERQSVIIHEAQPLQMYHII